MLINNVLPAINNKWPQGQRNRTIWIQHDNATSHIQDDDALFVAAQQEHDLDVRLYYQLPNSPDLNVLDLGFFYSLQSKVKKEEKRNKGELIARVTECFAEYPHSKINCVFLSLQMVMEQIILCNGDNSYKLQHINKEQLEQMDALPVSILSLIHI